MEGKGIEEEERTAGQPKTVGVGVDRGYMTAKRRYEAASRREGEGVGFGLRPVWSSPPFPQGGGGKTSGGDRPREARETEQENEEVSWQTVIKAETHAPWAVLGRLITV
jgi:hypothetical protein